MALKDHTRHFQGLQVAPTPAALRVQNTVSRNAKTGDRSFISIVAESGKPVLDAELNLHTEMVFSQDALRLSGQISSGWLRGTTHHDGYCDYITTTASADVIASDPNGILHADGTLINSVILPKLVASVAGYPVVVEFTNTGARGYNLIQLTEPSLYDGTNATVKRTDFLFLEVWKALVAPSPRAEGLLQVVDASALQAGDQVEIDLGLGGAALVGVLGAPGIDEFQIDVGSEANTAQNIADALNDPANSFAGIVTASSTGAEVFLLSVVAGEGDPLAVPPTGNHTTLGVTVATVGAMVVSGPFLIGGEDRPNKPEEAQDKVYRHGNTLSPESTWLDDEMVDSVVGTESSQRIQLQYRIRASSDEEQINYKKHPDGFSSLRAGGGPNAASVFAQGGRDIPVWSGNGIDTLSYPFVRADGAHQWLDSDAEAFGIEDSGLWVAGDGSEAAAQALGSVDGFVYAIPLCFVHRHCNVSDSGIGFKGFDPINNANGAPLYDHGGYNGALGAIPAGESDRPDGHFADVIVQDNLLDLRKHVVPFGIDYSSELQYQMQSLLDGSLRTWSVDIADQQILGGASGDVSTRFLVCNEIGRDAVSGGNAPFSGDTDRGETVRNFDHIARRFGDQPVVERVLVAFYPGDRPDMLTQGGPVAPGVANEGKYVTKNETVPATVSDPDAWYEGDTLVFDLTRMDASTLGGVWQGLDGDGPSALGLPQSQCADFAPVGTVITDVIGMWHDDGHYTMPIDQSVQASVVLGLGTQVVSIRLDANGAIVNGGDNGGLDHKVVGSDVGGVVSGVAANLGSPRRIFVEFEVTYPIGVGLTDTPDHEVTPSDVVYDGGGGGLGPGPVIENAVSQRPADFETLLAPRFRQGYRETCLEYVANDSTTHAVSNAGSPIGSVNPEQIVSRDRTTLYFPRRVFGASSGPMANQTTVNDAVVPAAMPIDLTTTEFGSSSRKVVLSSNLSGLGQTLCDIQYFAQDPIPNYGAAGAGYQVSVYFRSNAPQTAGIKEGDILNTGDGVLPTILRVEPLLFNGLWTGQVGTGSNHNGYPYALPLDQIPVNEGVPVGVVREWFFAASATVAVDNFNADTGILALHPFLPADTQNVLTLGGVTNDQKPRKDAEFRAFYPYTDTTSYRPTILSQPLHGATRHKVMAPLLARVVEDVTGVDGGILFRKSEILLVVLSRFAELDDGNNVAFVDDAGENRSSAAVYRTRNMLLSVGDRTCL